MVVISSNERQKVVDLVEKRYPFSRITFKPFVYKGEDVLQVITEDLNLMDEIDKICYKSKPLRNSIIGKI